MQVGLQFLEGENLIDGRGVTDHVDVGIGEVDDPLTAGVFQVRRADVPLIGDNPVQDGRAAGHFVDAKPGKVLGEDREGSPYPVAGEAAMQREELSAQIVHPRALDGCCLHQGAVHASYDIRVSDARGSADVLLVIATLGRRPEFLHQTLTSIVEQDIPADIVIVAPVDRPQVQQAAKDFGARLLPDPGSLPAAINLGVTQGLHGHLYVNWLNDDDLLTPGSLRATTRALGANPAATVAFGACQYIDQAGRELWVSRAGRWAPRVLSWGPDLIPQPGMLVRSSAWRTVGGLDTSYRLAFDLDLLLKLKKLGPLIDTGTVVSKFRWHADSLTVDDRSTNIAESERAKRAALSPSARKLAWLWEPPVRAATKMAAREVQRRASRLSGTSTSR